MRPPPSGHMVINMKTTITTHGAHNGVIVHAGVQSGAGTSQESQWYVPSRFPQIETPGGTRLDAVAAGTSRENLATSWPSLAVNTASPQPQADQRSLRQERSPLPSRQEHSSHSFRLPSPPLSPVFSFSGRDSPPDEFIQPTRVTLNVFNPGRSEPIPYETSLRRTNPENADALINDTVTTTTTVEVFRTPLDPANPDRLVALPPPPVPSIDDRPQLLRVNGPGYERWSNHRTETLINDRPVHSAVQPGKAVQWKEMLVEGSQQGAKKTTLYDPYSGQRSPYANAVTSHHPPSSHQYQLPTVNSFNDRLIPRLPSKKPPYIVHSPSEFSPVSHPAITSSSEDLSRSPYARSPIPPQSNGLPEPVGHPAIPDVPREHRPPPSETPILSQSPYGVYEQVRRSATSTFADGRRERPVEAAAIARSVSTPLYVEPVRDRSTRTSHQPPEARRSRRSQSSHRRRREREAERFERHRSESPAYRQPVSQHYGSKQPSAVSPGSYLRGPADPNRLPGEGPTRASSREIFNLYQTRDILQNVVAQFEKLGYGYSDNLLLSPLAESEDSLISELSSRADRTKSDALDAGYEEVKPRPLHRTSHASFYDDFYEELDHIYEELDTCRKITESPERSVSASTLVEEEIREEPMYAEIIHTDGAETSSEAELSSEGSDVPVELNQFKALIASIPSTPGQRKAHPDGLVFPRITNEVLTLPELPEEHESQLSQSSAGTAQQHGIVLVDMPYADDSDSVAVVAPSDISCESDVSKKATLRHRAEVRADQHKLVIHGWETLISDSDEGT